MGLKTKVGLLAFFARVVRSWKVASGIEGGSPNSAAVPVPEPSPMSIASEEPVLLPKAPSNRIIVGSCCRTEIIQRSFVTSLFRATFRSQK